MKYQKEDLMYGKFIKRFDTDHKKRRKYEILYFPFENRMVATMFRLDDDNVETKVLLHLKVINKKFHPKYQDHIIYRENVYSRRIIK